MVTLNMVTIFILFLVIVKECFKLINFSKQYIILGMLTGTRVPGTRIYYPNPGS